MLTASSLVATVQARKCCKCGATKLASDFRRNASVKDGIARECRDCAAVYDKNYALRNKEKLRIYHKQWRDKNPEVHLAYGAKRRASHPEESRRALEARRARNPKLEWSKQAILNSRNRAQRFGLDHMITVTDVLAICEDNCPALGFPLVYPSFGRRVMGGTWQSPSLDRIRPEIGYVVGNIAVISRRANVIKNDATAEDVARVAKWMRRSGC